MISLAGNWPWHLRQVVSGLTCLRRVNPASACGRCRRRRALGFFAVVLALVAGGAGELHQLLRHRRHQVAAMEAVLLAAVGAGELVPGEAVGGAQAGRGRRTRLVLQYFLVAGQALGIRRRLDCRLEMQRAVAGAKHVLPPVSASRSRSLAWRASAPAL
jgi:hypothetical protein